MPRMKIAYLTNLFGLVIMVNLIMVAGIGMIATNKLKVGGPLYTDIVLGKDLVADILPPPEYIIESYLEATLALNDPAQVDERTKALKKLKSDYDDRHQYWVNISFDQSLKSKLIARAHEPALQFYTELDKNFLPALARGDMDAAQTSYKALSASYAAHRAVIDEIVADATRFNSAIEAKAAADDSFFTWIVWISSGVAVFIMLAGSLALHRGVINPVVSMTKAMKRLADGDLDGAIPSVRRGDEIGQMAKTVEIFKQNAIEAHDLRQREEEQRAESEREKLKALRNMAETVEHEARSAVESVELRTSAMNQNAQAMAQSAESVSASCQNVAAAATQALTNAQTVAAASEELSASITEIGHQIHSSRNATAQAVDASAQAQTNINRLADIVTRIGEISQLINDIASQTNLLALNATIEAARAGDAGKGFAVVANEVKSLATQTARATGDISTQISEIQSATGKAVSSVQAITSAIHDVESISTAIASAIEEQSAATAEIARNVIQTSDAAHEVARRITDVSQEAQATGTLANDVNTSSAEVAGSVSALRDVLVRVVRTATRDVDRRGQPRYSLNTLVSISHDGASAKLPMINCSEGGIALDGTIAGAPIDTIVTLAIDGLSPALKARILLVESGHTHLHFEDSPKAMSDFRTRLLAMTATAAA